MSVSDLVVPDLERGVVRVLQLGLVAVTVHGVLVGKFDLVLNGAVPLLVTFVPAYLRKDYGVRMDTGLVFLLTAAAVVHTVGIMGPYQSSPWYDEVAHSLSASVVALSGYAVVRALDIHSGDIELPPEFVRAFAVVFVVALGGFWELFELGMGTVATWLDAKPPLVVFGLEDAVLDIAFNTVGGIVVALVAPGYVSTLPRTLATRLMDRW